MESGLPVDESTGGLMVLTTPSDPKVQWIVLSGIYLYQYFQAMKEIERTSVTSSSSPSQRETRDTDVEIE